MAAPSSSTYSALLRRSKLASLTPGVEQVYTTSPANLSRGNWGLKRPLPQASTTTSPFVRLFDLDSPEGRTTFRKATREAQYVQKWAETGVGLNSDAHNARNSPNGTLSRAWDRLPVQSRFVDGDAPGAIRPVPAGHQHQHAAAPPRMPNFFAMSEREFERFLADLGERRDEFRTFVLREAASSGQQTESPDEFDLYAHAQRNPLELVRLVERFLRLPSSTSTSSSASSTLPQIHPTLALQYASPTPLESALAAPIPGRLLGPSPDGSSTRSGGFASMYGPRSEVYASLLSQVAPVPSSATAATPSTSFFPDATGARSNLPGRAHFRLQAPTINPIPYASRSAITRGGVRQSTEFRPPTAEYEPSVLALRSVDLRAQVVPSAQVAVPKPLPGTPAYSGDLPPEVARYGAGSGGRGGAPGAGGGRAASLTDLYAATGSLRSLGVKGKPKDLLASRKNRRSKEDQDRWVRQREALLEQSGQDARAYAAKGRKDGERQQGGKGHGKGGRREQSGKKLISRLEELLDGGNQ